jgi:hypothetical protein
MLPTRAGKNRYRGSACSGVSAAGGAETGLTRTIGLDSAALMRYRTRSTAAKPERARPTFA